jgi:hypothetical protein
MLLFMKSSKHVKENQKAERGVSLQRDYVKALRGLGRDVWRELGGAEKYIHKERASWQDTSVPKGPE